ncbi:MAG: hypothetical protein AB1758_11285, partial [Candidatus Eremiobacterota bacterium]
MVITTSPSVSQYRPLNATNAGASASETQQAQPQPQAQASQGQNQQAKAGENQDAAAVILNNLTSSPEFTKKVLGKLGQGDSVTITVNGDQVLQIKNEGPGVMQKFIKGTQMFITAAAEEAANLVQADPAFAFKEAAMGVKTQVYNGLPSGAADFAENAFLPMLRIAALTLDAKKAMDTWKNKDADQVTKIIDTAHVVTDVVGVVGALGDKFIPALGGVSGTLTAIGLAGDIAAYSYHVLSYLRERGQVNYGDDKQAQPAPQPAPAPPPSSNQAQAA